MLPKYVIINEFDCPMPDMVCQHVAGIGYCYMDRSGYKSTYDGMKGDRATPIEEFGFTAEETPSGEVIFTQDRPVVATYSDGAPRRWQSQVTNFRHNLFVEPVDRPAVRSAGASPG